MRLSDLRTQRGLSQEDLARELRVTTRIVQRWEKGERPSRKNREDVAAFFGVDVFDLWPTRRPVDGP
jgi:transcriptional regulator with XRE-family HTH domain